MSNNREPRIYQENVHLFLALQRTETSSNKKCFRHVIRNDEENDLKIVEAKCKIFGDIWRIHKTANARNIEKARIWLMKHLIDNPKNAQVLESAWKTALLQKECRATKYFMFDVDTEENSKVSVVRAIIDNALIREIKSPKGYHFISHSFDTREICKLDYVTLLRDGYHFVKIAGGNNL